MPMPIHGAATENALAGLNTLRDKLLACLTQDTYAARGALWAMRSALEHATAVWAAQDLPCELGELAAEANNTLFALAGGLGAAGGDAAAHSPTPEQVAAMDPAHPGHPATCLRSCCRLPEGR